MADKSQGTVEDGVADLGSTTYAPFVLQGTSKWEGWTPFSWFEKVVKGIVEAFIEGAKEKMGEA
jgi:hypothetical protein